MKSLVKLSIIIFCSIAYQNVFSMEFKPTKTTGKIKHPYIAITSIENNSKQYVEIFAKGKKFLEIAPKKTISTEHKIFFTKNGTFRAVIEIMNKNYPSNTITFNAKINVPKNKAEYDIVDQRKLAASTPVHAVEPSAAYTMTIKITTGANENEIKATIAFQPKKTKGIESTLEEAV